MGKLPEIAAYVLTIVNMKLYIIVRNQLKHVGSITYHVAVVGYVLYFLYLVIHHRRRTFHANFSTARMESVVSIKSRSLSVVR